MKKEHYLGIWLWLLFIWGGIHTTWIAYYLHLCKECSAPRWIALFFPWGLYFFLLTIGAIIYFFIRKKYIFAWSLLTLLITTITIFTLNIKSNTLAPMPHKESILAFPTGTNTHIPEPQNNEEIDIKALIEHYTEETNNKQLKYPRLQETYFCGYEEFDREQKKNQITSYGWQLCKTYFIQKQEITCPDDEAIRNECFGNKNCDQCVIKKIPRQLIQGEGFSWPRKFTLEMGKVIEQWDAEDGWPDENGEGGYYNSTKTAFSEKAFKKFKSYNLTPELQEEVLHKAQDHFWFWHETKAIPWF